MRIEPQNNICCYFEPGASGLPCPNLADEITDRPEAAALRVCIAAVNRGGDHELIRQIRGKDIAMIFQEPMSALSPVHTIGDQIVEAILLHFPITKDEAKKRAIEVLGRVGIPLAADRFGAYTFELSGGMRQRDCIAMALSCKPRLLIADEPTTALDVTTQANILDLIAELQAQTGMAVMFVTHDPGVSMPGYPRLVVMSSTS